MPVQEAQKPLGGHKNRLHNLCLPAWKGYGLKLEPRLTRDYHLCPQPQQAVGLNRLHPEKVQRIPHAQFFRIAAPPAESGSTNQSIAEPSQLP